MADVTGNMSKYPRYYLNLQAELNNQMLAYKNMIELDIKRTGHGQLSSKEKETLCRILYSYTKRNKEIGYCQGMNFVCHFLLKQKFSEQEVFWLLVYIFERLLPRKHYTNMISVVSCVGVFELMLQERLPKVLGVIKDHGGDIGILMIPCFLAFFAHSHNMNVGL